MKEELNIFQEQLSDGQIVNIEGEYASEERCLMDGYEHIEKNIYAKDTNIGKTCFVRVVGYN